MIDPNLLQLIGLGLIDDPDLENGRHLRWMFHRLLGFPRTGFTLQRRPSLVGSDFNEQPNILIYRQRTHFDDLGNTTTRSLPNGLTVSKADGFSFGPPGSLFLTIAGKPIKLDFGPESPTGDRTNPAAYVLLTFTRRAETGSVLARGYYNARPRLRPVDHAAVGSRFDFADVLLDIRTVGNTRRVFSSAERTIGEGAVVRRDALTHAALAGRGLLPPPSRAGVDANPFVTNTLLLHGGLLEHIEITGRDAHLMEVLWITTQNLILAHGWRELHTYHLPFTHSPELYPVWDSDPNEVIASKRLHSAPLKRQAPWDREDGGTPPLLLSSVPTSVDASLLKRYWGNEFKAVEAAIHEFLRGELTQIVPQALVTTTERIEPEDGDNSGPEPMDVTVSPFDLLYGASADPVMARLLGLATFDKEDPTGIYDYAVHAGFPLLWVRWLLGNREAREFAQRLRDQLNGAMASWQNRIFAPFPISSVVTGLKQTPAVKLAPPAGLTAKVIPDATRSPVQARVSLSWPRGPANLFERPNENRVLHVFKRVADAGDVLLHHRDDATKLLAPHLPTPHGEGQLRLHLTDRNVPNYGVHTWKVAAFDLFGRLSDDAVVSADVRDLIAPPPPGNVEAVLEGDATTGTWTRLRIAFDWLPSHESAAPDLRFFQLHVRQGFLIDAEAPLPTTWGKLETTPGATAGPIKILWPEFELSDVPGSVAANLFLDDLAAGGKRITVLLAPLLAPFDTFGYARLAAAVRAFDQWGNSSGFAVARAERVDLSVPPPPSFAADPQLATRRDAQNRSWFRVPIPVVGGATVRVLRASSVALLTASNTEPAAFAALSEPEQVGLLRTLSVDHSEPFATDHEQPLPADGNPYLMEFGGFERGLTVVTLLMINRTGALGAWPSNPGPFIVIKVPRNDPPPTPLISDIKLGNGIVALTISPDVTSLTRAVAVYRARSAADAADVRRMRFVKEKPIATPAEPTVVVDDSGLFDEVNYFYRVVAVGDEQLRSAPTAAISVTLIAPGPPPPPVISAIERDAAAFGRRRVRLIVPRRDYAVFLFRRRQFALDWEIPTGPGIDSQGKLNFTALTTIPNPEGYEVVINDIVTTPDQLYSYFARIEDPRGRVTAGAPRLETP